MPGTHTMNCRPLNQADRVDRADRADPWVALGIVVVLLAVYFANGPFLINNDALPNLYLSPRIIERGKFLFEPADVPFMFRWTVETDQGSRPLAIHAWTKELDGLRTEGVLRLAGAEHFLRPTSVPDAYVGTYGIGAGLTALPIYALARAAGMDLEDPLAVCWLGKFAASLCVAVAGGLIFLTARRFAHRPAALAGALGFGLGTSVWALASQTLVQHGPAIMYLSLAAWLLFRPNPRGWQAAAGGAALGLAFLCRPTNALAVPLLAPCRRPRLLVPYAIGAAPAVALQVWLNIWLLGSPTLFPQTAHAAAAIADTPAEVGMWSTPFVTGLAGLLVSPSRGVFVYSPLLLLGVGGVGLAVRDRRLWPLLPGGFFCIALVAMNAKWFQWFGGWDYAYRLLLDGMPFWALLLVPTCERLFTVTWGRIVVGAFAAWSIGVQALGAATFSLDAWNNRTGFIVRAAADADPRVVFDQEQAEALARSGARVERGPADIGKVQFRSRLWSWSDWQIGYLARHAGELARRRWSGSLAYTANYGHAPDRRTGIWLAGLLEALGRREGPQGAEGVLRRMLAVDPADGEARVALGRLLLEGGRTREARDVIESDQVDDPARASPRFWLLSGDIARAGGDRARALADYERAATRARANPADPATFLAAAAALAMTLAETGDRASLNKAHQWALLATNASGNRDPAALEALAVVLARVAQVPEASFETRRAEARQVVQAALEAAKRASDTLRVERLERLAAQLATPPAN